MEIWDLFLVLEAPDQLIFLDLFCCCRWIGWTSFWKIYGPILIRYSLCSLLVFPPVFLWDKILVLVVLVALDLPPDQSRNWHNNRFYLLQRIIFIVEKWSFDDPAAAIRYLFWMWNTAEHSDLLVGGSIHCHYLFQAICKIISDTAQPYIKDYGPKFKLDSVEFESLTLGTLPPTFVGKRSVQFFHHTWC
jgi:hypothetical protein